MRRSEIEKMDVVDGLIVGFRPKFRSLDRDWEDYLEAIVELESMGKLKKVLGQSLYESHGTIGSDWLFGQYFERKLYAEIEAYLTPSGEGFFNTMYPGTRAWCQRMVAEGEAARAIRIWKAHVAAAKAHFWFYIGERKHGFRPLKGYMESEANQRRAFEEMIATIPEKKALMLEILREYKEFAIIAKAPEAELARIRADIAAVEVEERPAPNGPLDNRSMEESVFWELIGTHREPLADRLDSLPERLAVFKPAAIRKFDLILREKHAAAYRSDVWALAYLLQGGCSDDSFDAFRGWLILQGRDVFETTLTDPDGFDVSLHTGMAGGMDALRDAAPAAHDIRAGKPMKPVRGPVQTLVGAEIAEADFDRLLPRISSALAG